MKHRPQKKLVIFITVLTMLLIVSNLSFAENHWAEEEIKYLLEKEIVSGYPDGQFRPNQNITRAEFVKIINNVIGVTEKTEVYFKDVDKQDWFYEEIAKAVGSGYIQGYGENDFKPNNPITRQEAAKIIVSAFGLENDGSSKSVDFTDSDEIAVWARKYVETLKNKGYMSGYTDGTFRGDKPITRAEVVKMINNVTGIIVNSEGYYSNNAPRNLLVNTSNVNLKDIHIPGDLYLTEGVGNGSLVLDNVTVDGTIYIKGGGSKDTEAIAIRNSKLEKVIINKASSEVHVAFDNSKVNLVAANPNTKLTVMKGTQIKLMEVIGKSNIEIEKGAVVDKIQVKAKDVEIKAKGDIKSLDAIEDYKLNGKTIKKGSKTSIEDGKIIGAGKKEEVSLPDKPRDKSRDEDKGKEDEKPTPIGYKLDVRLNKDKYEINEEITILGKATKDNIGLANIDITLKLGDKPITVGQLKTDINGEFVYKFKVPEGTDPGKYKLFVKANKPVNKFSELDIELVKKEEKHTIDIKLDKEKYIIDEEITVLGTILEYEVGLSNVDITMKLQDEEGKEIITVDQVKTNDSGSFMYKFKVPEGINMGKYRLVVKINQPVNRLVDLEFRIVE